MLFNKTSNSKCYLTYNIISFVVPVNSKVGFPLVASGWHTCPHSAGCFATAVVLTGLEPCAVCGMVFSQNAFLNLRVSKL